MFDPIRILISLPGVFLAMSFHEYAHAWLAYKMGDTTPVKQGRLTMDPLVHIDWVGLIMFAVFRFGWAKPVKVNPSNFKNRKWGEIFVSISGPLANMIMAIVFVFIYFFALLITPSNFAAILLPIIQYIISLNIIFSLLNLIPIPPFDGYNIIKNLLFSRNIEFFMKFEQYSIFVLFALILSRAFDFLVAKPAFLIEIFLMRLGYQFYQLFI